MIDGNKKKNERRFLVNQNISLTVNKISIIDSPNISNCFWKISRRGKYQDPRRWRGGGVDAHTPHTLLR